MRDNEKHDFAKLMTTTMAVYEKTVNNSDVISLWWNALSEHELHDVRNAFSIHIKQGEFVPKPANILSILNLLHPDGHPSADEAWAMVPKDEAVSVVMTEEMLEAWGIAKSLLDLGDMIAARMAFKSAYMRLVDSNRNAGIKIKWVPSLGHDKRGREACILEAVRLGRIGTDHAKRLGMTVDTPMELEEKTNISVEQARTNLAKIKAMVTLKSTEE